ncbi:MAG TPA: hypothetical protein VI139_09570 [Gemmatimonadales bacterium]
MPAPDISRDPDPVVAVVLDRTHARFFEVSGTRVTEVTGLVSPDSRRDGHYAATARRLLHLKRVRGARGLLLAGPGTVARAFRRSLPAGLAARVIGTAELSPLEVTAPAVRRATSRARQGHRRGVAARLVAALRAGIETGWAVNGTTAVAAALQRRRVRVLFVGGDDGAEVAGAIAEARRQRVPVCVVRGGSAAPLTGVAALLRHAEVRPRKASGGRTRGAIRC